MTEPDATTWPLHPVPMPDDLAAMSTDELLAALAAVHDALPRLRDMEKDLATALGKAEGALSGNLADGRQFTLKRTSDRTAWDHEDWKRDARRVIVQRWADGVMFGEDEHGNPVPFYVGTGEATTLARILQEAVAEAQEVHGSTAPRSTALKRLGLFAGDYSTSSPGGWKFDAITPSTAPDTTTKDA